MIIRAIALCLFVALGVAACNSDGDDSFSKRCKESGGVPVAPTYEGGVCMKKDATIPLPRK